MKTLRQVSQYELYQDELTNLFAVSNNENVSLWFDKYIKDDLLYMTDKEFVKECIDLIGED